MLVLRSARWWLLALLLLGSAFFFSAKADYEHGTKVGFVRDPEFPGALNITVEVANHKDLFLLDTGATSTAISRRLLGLLITDGDALPRYSGIIELANGASVSVYVYTVTNMKIGGCKLSPVNVLVFQGQSSNILGIRELRRLGPFVLDTTKNVMVFNCPQ